jgi:cytochrome c oxidase subunit 2
VRRGSIVQMALIGLVTGAIAAAVAIFVPWLPTNAAKERDGIDLAFWLATWICIAIFALVTAVLIYAVIRFRVRPEDDSDGPPIHGHTGLEIVWTAVPTVLVTVIAIVSSIVLVQNDRPDGNPLHVEVLARQFAWQFRYPEQGDITTTALRLPLDRSVKLHFTAYDVIHSFWVPEFGQKMDAVPGQDTDLVITPTKVGTYPVICTELCGLGHALMRSEAVVMPAAEFEAWAKQAQADANGPPGQAGKSAFASNGCGSCHTFAPAGATGKVGPDLDKLPDYAKQAGKPLDEFVQESITDPNAYIEPGYPKGVMPPFSLPTDHLDALVQYLTQSSKGA